MCRQTSEFGRLTNTMTSRPSNVSALADEALRVQPSYFGAAGGVGILPYTPAEPRFRREVDDTSRTIGVLGVFLAPRLFGNTEWCR